MVIAEGSLGRRKSNARSGRDIVNPESVCRCQCATTGRGNARSMLDGDRLGGGSLGGGNLGGAGMGGAIAVVAAPAIVRQHEVGDTRRDFGAEARAVEHAVMAD